MSDFRVFAPLRFFRKGGGARRIAGIISTEAKDKQDEIVLQRGLDFKPFLDSGWFNDNHSQKTVDVLGYPKAVKQFRAGDKLPDGSIADVNGTWAEGELLDTPEAQKVWDLGLALQKAGSARRLGFSIEGKVLARTGPNGKTVAKALVRNVAVTNCFPGDVRVCGSGKQVTRRSYSGPMIEIVLATGEKLSGTPHHPVFTQRGWVGLGDLDEVHDRVGRFCSDVVTAPKVTHQENHVPPSLQEVFDLALALGCETRPVRKGDFHGDVIVDGNVDVVLTDRLLQDRLTAAFLEKFGQDALSLSGETKGLFPIRRALAQLRQTCFLTAARVVGCLRELSTLVRGAQSVLAPVLIGNSAGNPRAGHDFVDGRPVKAKPESQVPCTLSRSVRFSNLLSKRSYEFSGHVFNLETAHGWYEANGIVAHNCPVGDGTRMEALVKSMRCVEDPEFAKSMGVGTSSAPPGTMGPQTGTGAGRVLAPQHLESEDEEEAAEEAEVKKSHQVAQIQKQLGCDRTTAERAFRTLINLKDLGLLSKERG